MTSVPRPAASRLPPAGVVRLLIVVGGGLVVLQSSQGLGLPKLVYLAVAGAAFLASCRAVWYLRHERRLMLDAGRPWLIASLLLVGLIALSLPVALANGTLPSAWLRDAATYGLFAAAPVFALDAASSARRGQLLAIIVAVGSLGALSYATNWIAIRNIAILPIDQFVLPTGSLPSVLFTVSLAAAILDRRRRLAWMVLGGLALGAFLITGTRSNLLLFVALPVVIIVAGRSLLKRSIPAALGVGLIGAALMVVVQAGFASAGGGSPIASPPPVVSPRPLPAESPTLSATPPPAESPTLSATPAATLRPTANPNANIIQRLEAFLASPQRDASLRERLAQYTVAWDLFVANPIFGAGLGHPFTWIRYDGSIYSDFTADTPLVLAAKLGILGIAWVLLVALIWIGFIRRLRRTAGITIVGLAMATWASLIVVFQWAAFSVEDKGFSLAVMLLLALGFVEIELGTSSADGPSASAD